MSFIRPPRMFCVAAMCLFGFGLTPLPDALAQEGVWHWALVEKDGNDVHLYYVDTDEGTDHFGPLQFECRKRSGWIAATQALDGKARKVIADLIMHDRYPKVIWGNDVNQAFSLVTPVTYSEMTGWNFGFEFRATSEIFEAFKKNGVFQYKIGEVAFRSRYAVGLKNAAKFQGLCTKPG